MLKETTYTVPALNERYPPETGGVEFLDRPCSVGGFVGTWDGFLEQVEAVAKPLLVPVLKSHPQYHQNHLRNKVGLKIIPHLFLEGIFNEGQGL